LNFQHTSLFIAKNSPVRRTTFSIRHYLSLKIRQCGGAQNFNYLIYTIATKYFV